MAIVRPKPKAPPITAEEFIGGAPDATTSPAASSAPRKRVMRGKKEQISLTLAPELIAGVDRLAAGMGQSRAAVIGMAVYRLIEQERRAA